MAVAEEAKGERLALGVCEDKNYRTIVAAAMANDHLVIAKTPDGRQPGQAAHHPDHDMGLPLERIVMDPTTGALGYGIEYGYSVMERLRLAALKGDGMTQQPMICTPGEEAWRQKEAKAGEACPTPGATGRARRRLGGHHGDALLQAGADILVLRHPAVACASRAARCPSHDADRKE